MSNRPPIFHFTSAPTRPAPRAGGGSPHATSGWDRSRCRRRGSRRSRSARTAAFPRAAARARGGLQTEQLVARGGRGAGARGASRPRCRARRARARPQSERRTEQARRGEARSRSHRRQPFACAARSARGAARRRRASRASARTPSMRICPSSMRTRRSACAITFLSCVEKMKVVPERAVDLLHQREDALARLVVEVRRRLVGEHDLRLGRQRARDRDALPLSAARADSAGGARTSSAARP